MQVKPWILTIWDRIDPIYYSLTRLNYVSSETRNNIFRVRPMRYRGTSVSVPDGTVLNKGDLVLKIHLHNVTILKELTSIGNEVKKALMLYRLVEQSLPGLAAYLKDHPDADKIKGVIGITMINRGCRSLGFHVIPLHSRSYLFYKWLTLLPIYLLSANRPVKNMKKHLPVYLYMPKHQLLNRYLP